MNTKPYAVIDIGSNSVKLLVAVWENDAMRVLRDELRITRLGEGLRASGRLADDAMRRTVLAVSELLTFVGYETCIVATEALRAAANADDFRALLLRETGRELRVLTGEDEARLSFLGATEGLALPGERLLLFDTGGGSTEVVAGEGGTLQSAASLPLGAGVLTEQFLPADPPGEDRAARLVEYVQDELAPHIVEPVERVVGVGGTVTSLAAMELRLVPFDGERVHGATLSLCDIERWLRRLAEAPLAERERLPGLHPQRARIITAGAAVAAAVLRRSGANALTVSDHGLRHGVWREERA